MASGKTGPTVPLWAVGAIVTLLISVILALFGVIIQRQGADHVIFQKQLDALESGQAVLQQQVSVNSARLIILGSYETANRDTAVQLGVLSAELSNNRADVARRLFTLEGKVDLLLNK